MGEPIQIIHIGAVKTGTTTLQNNVFSKLPGVLNIGRPYTDARWDRAVRALRDDDDPEFMRVSLPALSTEAIAKAAKENCRTLILSDETLMRPSHQALVARRLKEAFPAARILVTIRNQFDLVVSYWAAHGRELKRVPKCYNGKHVPFEDWFAFETENRHGLFSRLNYKRILDIYEGAFGKGRVEFLLFEEMVASAGKFANRLAGLLNVDQSLIARLLSEPAANIRPSAGRVRYQALRSWLFPNASLLALAPGKERLRQTFTRRLDEGSRFRKSLTEDERAAIVELFGASNMDLELALNLGLSRWGYPGLRPAEGVTGSASQVLSNVQ